MSDPASSNRSVLQRVIAGFFGLLSILYFLRFLQSAYNWMNGAVLGDTNFKALTVWALVYCLVCGGIAAVAWRFPRRN